MCVVCADGRCASVRAVPTVFPVEEDVSLEFGLRLERVLDLLLLLGRRVRAVQELAGAALRHDLQQKASSQSREGFGNLGVV